MKLGFDIDGIVADLPNEMVAYINGEYGLNHTVEIFACHDVTSNTYVDDPELNAEIAKGVLENIVLSCDVVERTKPYADAKEAIRKLFRSGHSVHFITARPKSQRECTATWLRAHNIPFNTLHAIGGDGPRGGLVSKGPLGRSLNLDFYIDDSLCHLEDMYKYKSRWCKGVALFTRPWNIDEALDPAKYLRFDKWDDVIRHLGIHKR
jgi:uncharacterized HAD superfamily protein